MRAAQLPNSDRTAIILFLTLLGHEIIKMTIFQPRHKRQFPRQLLNQPASGSRFFNPFWFPCATKFDSSISPEDAAVWTMKSPPLPVLWHRAWSAGERNRKVGSHQEHLLSEGKIQTNSSKWGISSPQAYAGERSHTLCWEQQPTSSSINILINAPLTAVLDINQTIINALWGKAIFVRNL